MSSTKHFTPLGNLADRLDEVAELNTEFLRSWQYGLLSKAAGGTGSPGSDVARLVGWAMPNTSGQFRGAVEWAVDRTYNDWFGGALIHGTIDVLRVGDGVQEGTTWGYISDGLRVAAIIPLARGATSWVRRGTAALRARAVIQTAFLDDCTWVASEKLLKITGTRAFVTLSGLRKAAAASGLPVRPFPFRVTINQLEGALRRLGAHLSELHLTSLEKMLEFSRHNPRGAAMVSVQFMESGTLQEGHTLLLRAGQFIDTYGDVFESVAALRQKYPGATLWIHAGRATGYFAPDAAVLQHMLHGVGLATVLGPARKARGRNRPWVGNIGVENMLALPVFPVGVEVRGTGPTLLSLYPRGATGETGPPPRKGALPEGYELLPELFPSS